MERARLVAQAISNGLNCICTIADALKADAPAAELAMAQWSEVLASMEAALQGVMDGEILSSMTVTQEHLSLVRTVRALVSKWTAAGYPPQELREVAESVVRLFHL